MSVDKIAAAAAEMGCEALLGEELKNYTTFKIGGKCGALIKINGEEPLRRLVVSAKETGVQYYIFGKGSNIIADGAGIDGVVFLMGKDFSSISRVDETSVECQAGASLGSLCAFAYASGLSGLEFAYGIPGTAGGAVYMNAGAYGGEIKDVILSARAIDGEGNIIEFSAGELDMSYRRSVFTGRDFVITSAVFKLEAGEKSAIKAKMDDLIERRREKQPLEYPSAGSAFKRPEGSYASLLIEQCGLKGLSVGGARISEKHSGFIINAGGATFDDIIALMKRVRETVKEKTGYVLECEPLILSGRDVWK